MAFRGQDEGALPTAEQRQTLEELLVSQCIWYCIPPKFIYGHREVPGMYTLLGNGSRKYKKTCPGLATDLDTLRMSIAIRLQHLLASLIPEGKIITGVWNQDWQNLMVQYQGELKKGLGFQDAFLGT